MRGFWTLCQESTVRYSSKCTFSLFISSQFIVDQTDSMSAAGYNFCVSIFVIGQLFILAYIGWWIFIHTSTFHVAVNRIPGPKYLPLIGNLLDIFGGLDRKELYLLKLFLISCVGLFTTTVFYVCVAFRYYPYISRDVFWKIWRDLSCFCGKTLLRCCFIAWASEGKSHLIWIAVNDFDL